MPESFYGIRFFGQERILFWGKGGKGFRFAELVPCHIFVFYGKRGKGSGRPFRYEALFRQEERQLKRKPKKRFFINNLIFPPAFLPPGILLLFFLKPVPFFWFSGGRVRGHVQAPGGPFNLYRLGCGLETGCGSPPGAAEKNRVKRLDPVRLIPISRMEWRF